MNNVEKVNKAFEICSHCIDDVNAAYVSTLNDMSEDDIEKRGMDDIRHDIACFQAVEASFSYGMVVLAGFVRHMLESDDDMSEVDEHLEELFVSTKVMSAVIAISNLLKNGKSCRSLEEYLGKAKKEAESVEEVSKMLDAALIADLLAKATKTKKADGDGPDDADGVVQEDDMLSRLKKAKGAKEERSGEE